MCTLCVSYKQDLRFLLGFVSCAVFWHKWQIQTIHLGITYFGKGGCMRWTGNTNVHKLAWHSSERGCIAAPTIQGYLRPNLVNNCIMSCAGTNYTGQARHYII